MSTRADLLALGRPALVALANAGFVKRAERELAEGARPIITSDAGTVTVTFSDAVVTLAPGRALAQAPCTCGATAMCRHRVAAVLAYQLTHVATEAPPAAKWSPGEVDDEALARLLGQATLSRARAAAKRGVVAEVVRAPDQQDATEAPWRVHLPTSTVRFLVARDVGHVRCDCTLRSGCEHVALAVWAFRAADIQAPDAPLTLVDLSPSSVGLELAALTAALDVGAAILLEGLVHIGPELGTRFALARHALERARLAWPLAALDALEDQCEAYRRRSARYDEAEVAAVIVELHMRARAGRGAGELPGRVVLGADEALETKLDALRLIGLGAHVEDDGDARIVHVFCGEPSSGSVLVFERRFAGRDDGVALGRRAGLAGAMLATVAHGQIVSNAVTRRANRAITFGVGPLAKTTVMPGGALAALASDVATVVARMRSAPPAQLAARHRTRDLATLAIGAVDAVTYDDGAQRLSAVVRDNLGQPFAITLAHRAVVSAALGALALALASGPTAVAGFARQTELGLTLTPLAIETDRLVALELEPPSDAGTRALASLPHASFAAPDDPLARRLGALGHTLAAAAHHGLRRAPPSFRAALQQTGLADLGLTRLARDCERLDLAHAAALVTGNALDEQAAVDAWADVAIRLTLARALR